MFSEPDDTVLILIITFICEDTSGLEIFVGGPHYYTVAHYYPSVVAVLKYFRIIFQRFLFLLPLTNYGYWDTRILRNILTLLPHRMKTLTLNDRMIGQAGAELGQAQLCIP